MVLIFDGAIFATKVFMFDKLEVDIPSGLVLNDYFTKLLVQDLCDLRLESYLISADYSMNDSEFLDVMTGTPVTIRERLIIRPPSFCCKLKFNIRDSQDIIKIPLLLLERMGSQFVAAFKGVPAYSHFVSPSSYSHYNTACFEICRRPHGCSDNLIFEESQEKLLNVNGINTRIDKSFIIKDECLMMPVVADNWSLNNMSHV